MTETTLHAPAPGSRLHTARRGAEQEAGYLLGDVSAAAGSLQSSSPLLEIRQHRAQDSVYRTMVFQPGQARQLVPRDPGYRYRVQVVAVDGPMILCDSQDQASDPANLATGTGLPLTVVSNNAPVTDPGATTTIASISSAQLTAVAPAQTVWQVTWIASLQGTVAAGDQNNMRLVSNLATIETGIFPAQVGNWNQLPVSFQLATPLAGLTVQSIGAASGASAIYGAQILATPTTPMPAVPVPTGFWLPVGIRLPVESEGLCWAVNPSVTTPVRVSVLTERYEDA